MTNVKKKFEQEAVLRNLSPRTMESYWWYIKDYCEYVGKPAEDTNVEDIRNYFQIKLTNGKNVPGSVKMGYYAIKFLFTQILNKEWASQYLPTPKTPKTLPLVLSQEEVTSIFNFIPNFKHRVIIMFIYSTGARVSECVNIKISDIDSQRMQINIQEGKGLKQRKVPLSQNILEALREYVRVYNPSHFLFEGGKKGTHISVSAVREICNKARYKTHHINKHYTPHTFRHSFATHMLEHGVNLLIIQRLMGHSDLSNTLKYLHVQQMALSVVKNPLDSIEYIEELCKQQ